MTEVLSVADIEALAQAALVAHGARHDSAASLARAIAAAERDGLASHGLAYLPTYCDHLDCGKVIGAAEPVLERTAPSVIVVDAGAGFAHPAIDVGLAALPALARTQGIATLAVRNSYNCGVLGYHTERIAAAGLVGLGFTNAPASIAPWGAVKPVLGTNPWSLAVPRPGAPPLVVDQSASVVAKSEVMKRSPAQRGTAGRLGAGRGRAADDRPPSGAEGHDDAVRRRQGRRDGAAGRGHGGMPDRRHAGRAGQPVLRHRGRAAAHRAVLHRHRA